MAKGISANIYTDSRYTFGIAHFFGILWKQRGLLTSLGQSIKNRHLISQLLKAILPKSLAVIQIPDHSKSDTPESRGKQPTEKIVKRTAPNTSKQEHQPIVTF